MSKPTSAVIQKSNEEKFINHLMKNGKKSVARRIYADALKEIKKAGHMNPTSLVSLLRKENETFYDLLQD